MYKVYCSVYGWTYQDHFVFDGTANLLMAKKLWGMFCGKARFPDNLEYSMLETCHIWEARGGRCMFSICKIEDK